MPFRYFDYFGRPARMTVDGEDIPELCEVWDPEQKKFVRDNRAETDLFFGVAGAMISEAEFNALVQERLAARAEPPVSVHRKHDDNK